MKTRLILFSLLSFPFFLYAHDAQLVLHPSQAEQTIPSEMYGQFAEHLGRCIYGGIWVGPDSEIANINGYRKDVVDAVRALEVPVLRWPGGCFADDYHWMDGIGPQEQRRVLINNSWGGTIEDNSFGTHEFLNFCELVGAEPYVSGNVGSGTVEEMSNWIEYMTSDTKSTYAEMRRKNGREQPWKVRYFGVGNECWGCGGNMRPEYYSDIYRQYATFCRDHGDNRLYKVVSGSNATDYNWTEVMMKQIPLHLMSGLSLHYYSVVDWNNHGSSTNFNQSDYYSILNHALKIEECITNHIALMDKYDPEHKVGLLVDEWGTWWDAEPGTNPHWLYQQNTMRDALIASASLDIFHRHTDRIVMANIAQMVNVLQAMILTNPAHPEDACVLTPTYYVFMMYKAHKNATYIPSTLECSKPIEDQYPIINSISYTASKNAEGVITLSLTNLDYEKPHSVEVRIDDMKIVGAEGTILTANDIHAYNDFNQQPAVAPESFTDFKVKGGKLIVNMPAHAVVTLQLSQQVK